MITLAILGMIVFTILGMIFWQPVMSQRFKTRLFQAYIQCEKEIAAIFQEVPLFSSFLPPKAYKRMAEIQKKYLTPLGPQALPYLIVISQEAKWWMVMTESLGRAPGAVPQISKFRVHEIELTRGFTTEEFPEITYIGLFPDEYRIYLFWWLEGEKRTPQWFSDRYSKWLVARKQGDAQKTKAMYQKLLDIGIAAIPLWLEKLQSEQDESIRQEIMKALSYLTDGEVNLNMSPQECLKWWEANRERWTIPFPKSKKEFLKWLEREGWEEQMLSIPSVITISRLEDEEAIDVLIRFLRHPNPLVRGTSLGRIMILFGEQLPKEYALGVGTDGWETIGDLIEMGKYEWVEKKVKEAKERMREDEVAEGVAKEIFEWWRNNRGRVKIYWQRAWGFSE
jgi:hypothetical protein